MRRALGIIALCRTEPRRQSPLATCTQAARAPEPLLVVAGADPRASNPSDLPVATMAKFDQQITAELHAASASRGPLQLGSAT